MELTRGAGALLQLAHRCPRDLQGTAAGSLQRAHVGIGVPIRATHSIGPTAAAHTAHTLQTVPARRVQGATAGLAFAGSAHQAAIAVVGHIAPGAARARTARHVAARRAWRRRGLPGQRQYSQRGQRGQRGGKQRARLHCKKAATRDPRGHRSRGSSGALWPRAQEHGMGTDPGLSFADRPLAFKGQGRPPSLEGAALPAVSPAPAPRDPAPTGGDPPGASCSRPAWWGVHFG